MPFFTNAALAKGRLSSIVMMFPRIITSFISFELHNYTSELSSSRTQIYKLLPTVQNVFLLFFHLALPNNRPIMPNTSYNPDIIKIPIPFHPVMHLAQHFILAGEIVEMVKKQD